jgi:hypothetical protein
VEADLLLTVPDMSGFSAGGWVDFLKRYDLEALFPDGVDIDDQCGFLRATARRSDTKETRDVGFDFNVTCPEPDERDWFCLLTIGEGKQDWKWAFAHAAAAYFVSELDGTLEDPKRDVCYGPADFAELDFLVRELLQG